MRRVLSLVVLALLIASPAAAQQQLNQYPGAIVNIVPGAVTIANTVAATTMYSVTIPPLYFQNLRQSFRGSGALHLRLMGLVTTNQGDLSPGSSNMGCNFGGSTATISLVNGLILPGSLVSSPWQADIWVRQQGSGQFVLGQFKYASDSKTSNPTAQTRMAAVVGTTSNTANQTLTCVWQWSSATTTNSLIIENATLAIDN